MNSYFDDASERDFYDDAYPEDNYPLRVAYTGKGVEIKSEKGLSGEELHDAALKIHIALCRLLAKIVRETSGKEFEPWKVSKALTSSMVDVGYNEQKPERGSELYREYVKDNNVLMIALKDMTDVSELSVSISNKLSEIEREAAAILIMGAAYQLTNVKDGELLEMLHEIGKRSERIVRGKSETDPSEEIMNRKEGADE